MRRFGSWIVRETLVRKYEAPRLVVARCVDQQLCVGASAVLCFGISGGDFAERDALIRYLDKKEPFFHEVVGAARMLDQAGNHQAANLSRLVTYRMGRPFAARYWQPA